MSIARIMQQAAAGAAGEALAIEDVFSTYLYTGNGSTQTITNGIDLAGEGGLVWIKNRDEIDAHILTDTERGATETLVSNTTAAEATDADTLTVFNADGFGLGADVKVNTSTENYVSWTFRKAPRFFDVVTYTGTGVARTVSHNLGLAPGCIIVKRTDTTGDWQVYHRSNTANPETDYLVLNTTAATADSNTRWNDTAPTDSVFTVGTEATVNASGGTYVAYLFAHDPLGPSGDGSDGLIACGSYTGNGSTDGPEIDLGWEPQWLLIKNASGAYGWVIWDSMRGIADGGDAASLYPNVSNAENTFNNAIRLTPTGFKFTGTGAFYNASGNNYIYIAIRRGPMRQPTSGTEVFAPVFGDGSGTPSIKTSFPVDMGMVTNRASGGGTLVGSRITGAVQLNTSNTSAESSNSFFEFDFQNGWHTWTGINSGYINWNFRRAPGFFDVVAYTGGSSPPNTFKHNLGVAPELMIIKGRNTAYDWFVYSQTLGIAPHLRLNTTNAASTGTAYLSSAPDASNFYLNGSALVNNTGDTYIAYLFATLAGVSKVGSYTGNGSNQTINCGFTSGARFILIKRTDSAGDWYVWDTARGIVAANDPHLSLNTTAAEVTTDDSVDPDSSGFIVNQVAATNINVSSASYIYLAVS